MIIYIYWKWNAEKTINNIKNQIESYNPKYIVRIVKDISKLHINRDIIIPDYTNTQYEVFKHLYKNNENIYAMLDDKIQFYEYIKRNLTLVWGLHLIQSYDENYIGEDIFKHYIIKNKDSHHGEGNKIIEDHIYTILKNYDSKKFQIQDFLYTKYIDAVNLCCLEGKIIGAYNYRTYFPQHIVKETNYIDHPYVRNFLKAAIKNLNYNGFIEFEFLIDHTDTIYMMECNPRVSGCANSYYYFKSITFPYITALTTKNIKEINLEHKHNFFET